MESERINISWSLYHLKKLFRCSDKHPALLQNLLVFSFIIYVFYNLAYVAEHPISLFIQKICRWCVIPDDHQNVMMMIIFFVVWLTDQRRLALFPARTIVRDPHHCESPTRREFKKENLMQTSLFMIWTHIKR